MKREKKEKKINYKKIIVEIDNINIKKNILTK